MLFRRKSLAGSWQRLRRVCSPEAEASGRWMNSACRRVDLPIWLLMGAADARAGSPKSLRRPFQFADEVIE